MLMVVPSSIGLVDAADLRFRSSARTVMGEVRRSDPAPWRLRAAYSVDFRRWLVARLVAPRISSRAAAWRRRRGYQLLQDRSGHSFVN
jgi:hypothetical protein